MGVLFASASGLHACCFSGSGILCLRWDKHTELNLNQIQLGSAMTWGDIMRIAIILLILLFNILSCADASVTYTLPEVNKIEAEKHMVAARRYFLSGDYLNCIEELSAAQRENIYLVGVYLLRSLCERRLGMWDKSLTSIHYYLEVESADVRARLIEDQIEKEKSFLKNVLSGKIEVDSIQAYKQPFSLFYNLPLGSKPKTKALGKASSFEGRLWISDTEGNKVFMIERNKKPVPFDIDNPVSVVPLDFDEAIIVTKEGQIYKVNVSENNKNLEYMHVEKVASLPIIASDAVVIGEKFILVGDVKEGKLTCVDLEDGNISYTWTPTDEGRFEPLALSYGGYLVAIADRGSNSVIFMDPWAKEVVFKEQVELLRDVEWISPIDYVVLSEDGSLYIGNILKDSLKKPIEEKLENCWCLARYEDKIIALDTALKNTFLIEQVLKLENLIAFANLYMLEKGPDLGFLRLKANLNIPAISNYEQKTPSLIVGFGENFLPSKWERKTYMNQKPVLEIALADNYEIFLRKIYTVGNVWPSRLVMKQGPHLSGITDDFVLMLAGLSLREGIAIDLHMKDGPLPLSLTMLSYISGGKIKFSSSHQSDDSKSMGLEGEVFVSLPEKSILLKAVVFEPLLAVFGNINGIPFRDWIPMDFLFNY